MLLFLQTNKSQPSSSASLCFFKWKSSNKVVRIVSSALCISKSPFGLLRKIIHTDKAKRIISLTCGFPRSTLRHIKMKLLHIISTAAEKTATDLRRIIFRLYTIEFTKTFSSAGSFRHSPHVFSQLFFGKHFRFCDMETTHFKYLLCAAVNR